MMPSSRNMTFQAQSLHPLHLATIGLKVIIRDFIIAGVCV